MPPIPANLLILWENVHTYICVQDITTEWYEIENYIFFHPFAQYLYVCIVYGLMYNFFTAILSQIYPIFFSILLLPSFSNISSYCICKATAITTITEWKRYLKCPHITLDKYMNVHGNIYRCMDIHTPYTNMKMECRMTQKVGEKIKLWFGECWEGFVTKYCIYGISWVKSSGTKQKVCLPPPFGWN